MDAICATVARGGLRQHTCCKGMLCAVFFIYCMNCCNIFRNCSKTVCLTDYF